MISQEIIEEVKKRLVQVYNPSEIYLFGSYAWGNPTEDSDLDLLVIIDKSEDKRHKRSKQGFEALWGLEIPKDLMIYTIEEFKKQSQDPTTLAHKILIKGKRIYART